MKNLETAFEYICDSELFFYKSLTLHQRINYKSNWFYDPVNGFLLVMISTPYAQIFK
jgi:hypothetical protein